MSIFTIAEKTVLAAIKEAAKKRVATRKAKEKGIPSIKKNLYDLPETESEAGRIAAIFQSAGLWPLDKAAQFIKNEKDVIKYLNIIEATNKQRLKQKTFASELGKSLKEEGQVIEFPKDKITDWTKSQSRPPETEIIGGIQTTRGLGDLFGKQLEKAIKKTKATPKVVERSMPADDYYNFKEEWFGKIIANTDDDINTFLKKGINQADERFVTLSKDQRKDFLDMVEYRLKHGNEKFMNDSEMFFGYKKNGRKPHEYGGLAGMLGESTYQDEDHRVPYNEGGSISNVLPPDFDELNHDELMHIIKLLQTGEIPQFADGGRIGFKLGGIDKARRLFLQAMGAGAAGIGAAKTGLFGLLKGSKSTAVKNLTQIPIKDAKGMPPWFKPLVNRIIKEGEDITKLPPNKGGAFLDRQIVHSKKLGEGKTVRVYQTLDDQSIRVEYETAENMGGAPQDTIHLEYKAAEEVEPILAQHMDPKNPKGPWLPNKAQKTEPTFEASEPWPRGTTGDYKDITFDGENRVNEVKDLMSDTSTLKQFGTNKALSKEELKIAEQKRKRVNEINNDLGEQDQLLPDPPDYDGYASGGIIGLNKGGPLTTQALIQLYMSEGMSQEEAEAAASASSNLPWNILTEKAEGGRVGMLFGGGVWKTIIKNLAKEKGVPPSTYLAVTNYKTLPEEVRKIISKADFEKMKESRIEMFENWVEMAKTRQRFLKNIEEGKKGSPHAAPIFEHLEKSFKSPVPSGVTDKDILQGEYILKNLKTKGRKLNASGGLAHMIGE